jgi:hypothetical protein
LSKLSVDLCSLTLSDTDNEDHEFLPLDLQSASPQVFSPNCFDALEEATISSLR